MGLQDNRWDGCAHLAPLCCDFLLRAILCCQTLSLVIRIRVDFFLPLSQEQEEQEEQEEEQPLTKIYQKGVY